MGITTLIASAEGEQSILLPALPDLLWGSVSFVILLVLFSKFVLPSFNKVLVDRADKIEGGLQRAEDAQRKAQAALEQYSAQLAEARAEAATIRTAASDERKAIIEEARTEAQAVAANEVRRAAELVTNERNQAVSSLQRDVSAVALDLASKIVGASLQDDARARSVVDAFIADLERQASEAGR
ncbi:MAG: hypothetical protein RIS75_1315 [Actinomycetota bacterium]|jgi:F-type H+-transporting ATPase subunit b